MKPQDFMEALGDVSQEKLDALAKWQEAGTPVTGEAPVREKCIALTAAEPVSVQRRSGIMKQKKKAPAVQLLPWTAGIGVVIATCAVIAVSIGKEAIGQRNQMSVSMNVETSAAEQTAENVVDAVHEPVLLNEILSFSAPDETAIGVPDGGTAGVWHSMDDAAQIMQTDIFDTDEYFCEDLFAEYDVLYLAHPMSILPDNVYRFHISGGTFQTDGTLRMNLAVLALNELPKGWTADQTDRLNGINCYWFYTVSKHALPEIHAAKFEVTTYRVGELPEYAKDVRGGDSEFMKYLLTTEAYQDWENAIGSTIYITWENGDTVLPEKDIPPYAEFGAETNSASDTTAQEDSIIQTPPDPLLVPDLTGMDLKTAKQTAAKAGLVLAEKGVYDPEILAGKVIRTKPEKGSTLASGNCAEVFVSLGKGTGKTIVMPDFRRMDWETAKRTAEELGILLSKRVINSEQSSGAGSIFYQSVNPGERIQQGTVVYVHVPKGNDTNDVWMSFDIPEDPKGFYYICVRNEKQEILGTSTAFTTEGFAFSGFIGLSADCQEPDTKVQAVLVNCETLHEAVIGSYILHPETASYDTVFEDVEAAFRQLRKAP